MNFVTRLTGYLGARATAMHFQHQVIDRIAQSQQLQMRLQGYARIVVELRDRFDAEGSDLSQIEGFGVCPLKAGDVDGKLRVTASEFGMCCEPCGKTRTEIAQSETA